MQLFYNSEIKSTDTIFQFDKEESKHIIKVLRKRGGDIIYITNGKGNLFHSEITLESEKKCEVKIIKIDNFEARKYTLHIAIAPTKMNDRLEWFLEKATEIGIDEISLILCDHSERKTFKMDRAEKIIQAAMKQSNQFYLPKINEPISFNEFVTKETDSLKFIAHCEEDKKDFFKNGIKPNQNILVLIGPEGDFSTKEIALAMKNNFIPVSLGNTRLRTETAGIVACHTVALIN
ncbi:16S rRNA (uracil(1498)-N(3))-methyltransferase [uncultured Flavobacterium sp.]|mgnify:FL=1|uniref:16S rRNA (uracil(1498)-N(3))-methyltransferase n=1 Tax=uncultured Flavobacterium sp. TaxID=165435 RepID=UPI0030EC3743|tara:strand:+ start:169936 stop:170637 length:702 start_codon:yes stop_codon:yes gene_type:complete